MNLERQLWVRVSWGFIQNERAEQENSEFRANLKEIKGSSRAIGTVGYNHGFPSVCPIGEKEKALVTRTTLIVRHSSHNYIIRRHSPKTIEERDR